MANMSSFYGGRSAPSFTIVKSFDRIDASNVYTKSYYAIDNEGNIKTDTKNGWGDNLADSIVKVSNDSDIYILKRTENNFLNSNYKWNLFENNGSPIRDGINFPSISAAGMLQCFNKGVASLDEVNYQEYVLIDTVTNLNEYSNPDNGKIYRRGFDVNNGMYGAEYIGKITGPQGYNTGIQLESFETVSKANGVIQGKIESDLVGGNDSSKIECVYANVLDEGGNVLQTKIGFKFPYLVNTFKANQVSPYNVAENENLISETDKDGNILSKDHPNDNPFYRHWNINVPHGKKGDSIALVRKQPTLAPADIKYYTSLDNLRNGPSAGTLASSETISSDKYLIDGEGPYIQLDTNKFVKVEDCTNNKVFYVIRNYDDLKDGSLSKPIEIGDIDSIIKTDLTGDGFLTFYYDNGKTEKATPQIKWITNTELDNDTSKLKINYNQGSTDTITPAINYIKETYISSINDQKANSNIIPNSLYVLYSDPEYKKSEQVQINGKTGGWIKLGSVTPPASNLKILKQFTSYEQLDNNIPPESLEDDEGNPLGYVAYASGVLIDGFIYLYDYLSKEWYNTGTPLGQTINAKNIVGISNQDNPPSEMFDNSIWFGIVNIS